MMRLRLLCLLPLLAAGCSRTAVDAPGLGPRPIETQAVPAPDAAAEPETAATPALAMKLAALLLDADAAHARFEADARANAGAIARGRAAREGSEAWIAGQQALSALAARQGALRESAAVVDAMRVDPSFAGTADRAAIEAAAARIDALAQAERAAAGAR